MTTSRQATPSLANRFRQLLVLHRPPGIASELAVDQHARALLRRQLGVAITGIHYSQP
jgi:hypothetical protein